MRRNTLFKLFYLLFLLGLIGIFLGVYGRSVYRRSKQLYRYAKHRRRGWNGPVFEPDEILGFRSRPGAVGAHTFPIGENLPMRFDRNGFRVSVDARSDYFHRPYVLALGCSFTYGDACRAEDTYPHLVAATLGGTELNAGLCSYGLSQMLILARKLIPEYRPEYILFQYSPWLLNRSCRKFAPTRYSHAPNPYFIDGKEGTVKLHPPVFTCKTVDLGPWRNTPIGSSDFRSFFFKIGLPLALHDDFNLLVFKIKSALAMLPDPTDRRNAVIKAAYGEIKELAEKYDSELIIVGLGNLNNPLKIPSALEEMDLTTVNAHAELLSRLEKPTEYHYCRAYAHFRGDPPVRVDRHPNPTAHRIIADAILATIENISEEEIENLVPPEKGVEHQVQGNHLIDPETGETEGIEEHLPGI